MVVMVVADSVRKGSKACRGDTGLGDETSPAVGSEVVVREAVSRDCRSSSADAGSLT